MTFGEVIDDLKASARPLRACRSGWNGKGMWIALQVPDARSKMQLPYLYMKTAGGELVPWLASQTDMLADDWELLTESEDHAPDFFSAEPVKADRYEGKLPEGYHADVTAEEWMLERSDDGSAIYLAGYDGGNSPNGPWGGLTLIRKDAEGRQQVRRLKAVSEWVESPRKAG